MRLKKYNNFGITSFRECDFGERIGYTLSCEYPYFYSKHIPCNIYIFEYTISCKELYIHSYVDGIAIKLNKKYLIE